MNLRTGQRREGVFYAFMTLLQKFGLAGGLFLVGLFLEAANFLAESDIRIVARRFVLGATLDGTGFPPEQAIQPDSALLAIRAFMGPVPLLLLCGALVLCYFYPLTRTVHSEIVLQLAERRRQQQADAE
jgi:GPH family glycoside/pentoside/hexuronide:cation symporter